MGRWFSYFLNRKECITIASTELKTSVTYEATGEQTVFNIPFDYLRNSFVKAKIGDDGEPMEYGTDYTVANRQITFTTAPVGMLYVYRETPTDRMVQFMEGSVLKATDMNISTLQQLHIIEESQDWTTSNAIVFNEETLTWEGRNYRLSNLADPVNAQDVVTKHYMENVQDGFVQQNIALKDEATKQANIATQKAQLATEKANTAIQQADRAQAWAESEESPDGEPDSKSSKTWAEEAAQSASNAATSETNAANSATSATGSANEAASSASTATTQAGIATDKAEEAASSAASALDSKIAAATSAGNAATSEENAATSEENAASSATAASNSASAAAASAQEAADTAAGLGNPVMEVTENNGTVTVKKADNTTNTFQTFTLDKAYPVDSIYMSVNSANPSTFFGGTWEAFGQGRVLIGAGEGTDANGVKKTFNVGATGGEYEHKLTTAEIPSHNHKVASSGSHTHTGTATTTGNHTHTITALTAYYTQYSDSDGSRSLGRSNTLTTSSNGSHTHNVSISNGGVHTHTTENVGGSNAHNILNPYITVYIWRRTA